MKRTLKTLPQCPQALTLTLTLTLSMQPDVLTAALILGVWVSLGTSEPGWFLWRAPVIWASGIAPHVLRFLIVCFAPGSWCEALALQLRRQAVRTASMIRWYRNPGLHTSRRWAHSTMPTPHLHSKR